MSGDRYPKCATHDGRRLPRVARKASRAKKSLAEAALDTLAELSRSGTDEKVRLSAARHLLRLAAPDLVKRHRQGRHPPEPEIELQIDVLDETIEEIVGRLRKQVYP
jgi:hypothetical protein